MLGFTGRVHTWIKPNFLCISPFDLLMTCLSESTFSAKQAANVTFSTLLMTCQNAPSYCVKGTNKRYSLTEKLTAERYIYMYRLSRLTRGAHNHSLFIGLCFFISISLIFFFFFGGYCVDLFCHIASLYIF